MAVSSRPDNDLHIDQSLPAGLCNFRDLSREQAPTCTCRRFYLDPTRVDSRPTSGSAWCFCGHHACFHDHDPGLAQTQRLQSSHGNRRTSISELASQRGVSQEEVTTSPSSPVHHFGRSTQHSAPQTGIWDAINAFARTHAVNGSGLPSTVVPSSSVSQAQAPSRASTARLEQSVPLSGAVGYRPPHYHDTEGFPDNGSATEMNTPSMAGTPLFPRLSPQTGSRRTISTQPQSMPRTFMPAAQAIQPSVPVASLAVNSTRAQEFTPPSVPQSAPLDENRPSLRELQNLVKSCAQRLELLESMSYTHVPLDEVEDKFDAIDSRLIGLEEFRTELEARFPASADIDDCNKTRRRRLPAELTASFNSDDVLSQDSDASSCSAISATAAVYAEYNGRLELMSQRIELLEKIMPSITSPWHVEVVFLPWGRHLPGIWLPSTSFDNDQDSKKHEPREWTGTATNASGLLGQNVTTTSGWCSDSIQAWAETARDWLSAKACGPNGIVYHRLKSRGFVQTIELDTPDAFHFLQSCKAAFVNVLKHESDRSNPVISRDDHYALHEPFVPLRKVRKASRLRFLAPSEMLSSSLWTPSFLESSVFMKSKGHQRRLYITSPDAYMQQDTSGWTWSTIRALRTRDKASATSDLLRVEGGMDRCWAAHPVLDASPASFLSVNSSHDSAWSIESQPSFGQTLIPPLDDVALVSPVSEHRNLNLERRRTISIPPPGSGNTIDATQNKRRVASFENAAMKNKRRKSSIHSQAPRPGPAHTPRLSREPPSPFLSDLPTDSRSDNASGRRVVLTPLAYETPHSHTHNAVAALYSIDRDGFSDAETEVLTTGQTHTGHEEEWTGIGGEEQAYTASQRKKKAIQRGTEDTVIIRGSDVEESELDE